MEFDTFRFALGALFAVSFALPSHAADSPNSPVVEWTQEVGDSLNDEAYGVATDNFGHVYMTGQVDGNDAFLNKFDSTGTLLWQHRVGGAGLDLTWDVSVDPAGNIAMAGFTAGSLAGMNAGGHDVLLTTFDASGVQLWTRQLGSSGDDQAYGVDADGMGNIYLAGVASGQLDSRTAESDDLFIAKFDPSGTHLWTRQAGSSDQETVLGLAADAVGNAYITGWTRGDLAAPVNGHTDSFVRKYGPTGDILWTRQLGMTGEDIGFGIATDDFGNAYVTGYTSGDLTKPNAGALDGYVIKFDGEGNVVWQDQFGGSSNDVGQEISVDAAGNVYVAGATAAGPLVGASNLANEDVLLRKYDAAGQLVWNKQFGSSDFEQGMAIAVGGPADIYVAGRMRDTTLGPDSSRMDAFVTKLGEVPEPGTSLVTACGVICGALRWPRRRIRGANARTLLMPSHEETLSEAVPLQLSAPGSPRPSKAAGPGGGPR